jgi:O-antigen/teichoic acid export membrane protein
VNKQFSYAKFGICSSFIIWLVTSGPFVFLERYIPQEEYIASRVYLSVTGIISVLLVAIENKVLPTLSKLLKTGQKSSLALEIKQLNVSLFKIAATGSIACIVTVILAFPGTHNYIQIGLSYLAFQYFLCLSRPYTFIAKIKLKQANMLLVNIASLIIVLLALPFYMIETPAFIAANCSLTYAVSLFIIFYILDRTKRTYT